MSHSTLAILRSSGSSCSSRMARHFPSSFEKGRIAERLYSSRHTPRFTPLSVELNDTLCRGKQ
jgi:hypothetical protein